MENRKNKYRPFDAFSEFQSICLQSNTENERLGCLYAEAIFKVKRTIDAYYRECSLSDDDLFRQYAYAAKAEEYTRFVKKWIWFIRLDESYECIRGFLMGIVSGVIVGSITYHSTGEWDGFAEALKILGFLMLPLVLLCVIWLSCEKRKNSFMAIVYKRFLKDYELGKIEAIMRKRHLIESASAQVWRVTK